MAEKIRKFKDHLDKFGIDVIQVFSTRSFGPFDYLNEINPSNSSEHGRFTSKFKDGIYAIATAKANEPLSLFHLDETNNRIRISRPMKFLIGRKDDSGAKSSLLVYIPKHYMTPLKKAVKSENKLDMDIAIKAHDSFYANFYKRLYKASKDLIESYYSKRRNLRELALNGNRRDRVPRQVIEAIRKNKIHPKIKNFPIGSFEAHREEIELPNGQKKLAVLTITTKFNGSNIKNFVKENYSVSQKTENYSILYNLSIK